VWRSLVARFVRDEEAVGSNPATPTNVSGLPARSATASSVRSDYLLVNPALLRLYEEADLRRHVWPGTGAHAVHLDGPRRVQFERW
jgi:hypothetical protein